MHGVEQRPEFLVIEHFMFIEHLVDQTEQVDAAITRLRVVGQGMHMRRQRGHERTMLAGVFGHVGKPHGQGDILFLGEMALHRVQKAVETRPQSGSFRASTPLVKQRVDHFGKVPV